MTTNVLLINRQLVFAVTIKQALEQTRMFSVHPFTSAEAALDYLRGHPHDVALVDFTLPDYSGPQLVRRLRAVQPGIAVIVSPAQPNARALMQELELQGVVDAPFSARTIIPVIEHAIELLEQPLSARTRSLIDETGPDESATDVLPDHSHDPAANMLPLRGDFDDEEGSGTPVQTRVFDTDDDEDVPFAPPARSGGETRVLDDSGLDDEPLPWERPAPASAPIDFSSLSSILNDEAPSEMFEPLPDAEDTPSVPTIDSDAVRQFLATRSGGEDDTFGDVLGAIGPADVPPDAGRRAGSFDDLVNSMRADRQHTPLPDRHQQFMEFILTGGMDNLLTELEKAKTGPLGEADDDEAAGEPAAPSDTFTTLAAEEPPLPTLEESGTIGDLMIGVSDTSFRNVLALMRGEQVDAGEHAGFEGDFEAFFGQEATPPERDQDARMAQQPNADADIDAFFAEMDDAPPPAPAEPPRRDKSSIPARMILETAQDESTPADSFSLDTLIDSIERQLEDHLPDVKPLPSWGEAVKLPRRPAPPPAAERFVEEPDFLPETFAEPEAPRAPAPLPTWDDAPDDSFETTLASQAQREQIEQGQDIQETEAFVFDDTVEPEAAPEMEAEAAPPPDDEERMWPAESDMAAAWQTFVPATADADDEPPYAAEQAERPAFDDEPYDGGETLIGEGAFTSEADDDYADWMEGLLPPAQPAEPVYHEAEAAPAPDAPAYDDVWELAVDQTPAEETTLLDLAEAESDLPEAVFAEPAETALAAAPGQMIAADDPYIAQLALSLTQVSLELTAEATLLTRDGAIAAFAGTLAPEDVDALRDAVSDNWEAGEDEARIRFVALDGAREYMLYSRRTAGGFTLTMIFGGATPLRDIRRQGKRLLESLADVPDTLPEPLPAAALPAAADVPAQAAEPAQAATLTPCTYMWLLRDPNISLNEAASRAIRVGLHTQLAELGWHVQTLQAQDEYVYVYAHVPGERAAYVVADELKQRAADILRAQFAAIDPRTLWADSYLVMMPGRDLDADEIAQFIDFERLL